MEFAVYESSWNDSWIVTEFLFTHSNSRLRHAITCFFTNMFIRVAVLAFLFLARLRFPQTKWVVHIIRFRHTEKGIRSIQKFEKLDYHLTLSWRRPLLYRNQSIDLQSKSMNWFLYDNSLRHERVKKSRTRSWLFCEM